MSFANTELLISVLHTVQRLHCCPICLWCANFQLLFALCFI